MKIDFFFAISYEREGSPSSRAGCQVIAALKATDCQTPPLPPLLSVCHLPVASNPLRVMIKAGVGST